MGAVRFRSAIRDIGRRSVSTARYFSSACFFERERSGPGRLSEDAPGEALLDAEGWSCPVALRTAAGGCEGRQSEGGSVAEFHKLRP